MKICYDQPGNIDIGVLIAITTATTVTTASTATLLE